MGSKDVISSRTTINPRIVEKEYDKAIGGSKSDRRIAITDNADLAQDVRDRNRVSLGLVELLTPGRFFDGALWGPQIARLRTGEGVVSAGSTSARDQFM